LQAPAGSGVFPKSWRGWFGKALPKNRANLGGQVKLEPGASPCGWDRGCAAASGGDAGWGTPRWGAVRGAGEGLGVNPAFGRGQAGGRGGCEPSEPFCRATAEGSREPLRASPAFWVQPRAANPQSCWLGSGGCCTKPASTPRGYLWPRVKIR